MEGMSIEELFAGRNIDIPQMKKRLRSAAEDAGLPYKSPQLVSNSRLAQETGKWAECEGKGEAFHKAVFKAYFVEGKNIGDLKVLVDLAGQVGLPSDTVIGIIENRTFKKEVDADWARSKVLFVTAVPTFIIGMQRLVGAQPYDALKTFVENNQ